MVHGAIDEPAIEHRAVDCVARKAGDVEPGPVRHDAFRAGETLSDPLISGSEAIRRESKITHAFRALDGLSNDSLLFENRGPEARGRDCPSGQSSGASGAHHARLG